MTTRPTAACYIMCSAAHATGTIQRYPRTWCTVWRARLATFQTCWRSWPWTCSLCGGISMHHAPCMMAVCAAAAAACAASSGVRAAHFLLTPCATSSPRSRPRYVVCHAPHHVTTSHLSPVLSSSHWKGGLNTDPSTLLTLLPVPSYPLYAAAAAAVDNECSTTSRRLTP
jgi:hypothetical protein